MKVSVRAFLTAAIAAIAAGNLSASTIPHADGRVLPRGTVVHLMTMAPLSAADNKTGDEIYLEVADDVSLNGVVVIPRGSPAAGHVYELGHTGSHKLGARVVVVRVNGTDVPLHGLIKIRAGDLPSGSMATGATAREMPLG
ncbi:hypothetical protein KX816_03795 [Sphingosinicellaceae bacterium]|nr:hypothetical protein KX816_03795 [Sphingosinicellaceae bacterium]